MSAHQSPGPDPDPDLPLPLQETYNPALTRISLPFPSLLIASTILSFSTGALLGSALGGRTASLRFIAENAHRTPKSEKGWYLYYKSKNYVTMLGAVKEGTKNGLRLGGMVTAFVGAQAAVDRVRGKADAVGTVVAAMGVAGGWAALNRLSYGMAARTAKRGLVFGVVFGVSQDVLRQLKGEGPVGYLKWIPPVLKAALDKRNTEEVDFVTRESEFAEEKRRNKERMEKMVPISEAAKRASGEVEKEG